MLQGLMGGGGCGGGGWTNLLGGLMGGSGSTESAGGQQQGKYSKIGSLVGFGVGACFGGVGAPIGSMIGGAIGCFFDEQEAKKNVDKDKLREAGTNVACDDRLRAYASNGDIDRVITHLQMSREQELLNAGVRREDIDALYSNLREYGQGLHDYADCVCSMQRPGTGYADGTTLTYSRTDRLSITNGAAHIEYRGPIQFGNKDSLQLLLDAQR